MKRKNYWILFAILLLSLTSLSPTSDFTQTNSQNNNSNTTSLLSVDSPNQDKSDQILRISVQLGTNEFKKLELLNQRFIKETGIQVELLNNPSESEYDENSISKSLAMGEGSDVLLMESDWIIGLASKGYILPVESYLKSSPGGSVLRSLLPLVEWNGYQWGTPFDMNPYVLVWQPKALVEIGVNNPPSIAEDWNNLLSKQLQRKEKTLFAIDSDEPYTFAALIGGMGGSILHPEDHYLKWIEQALPNMKLVNSNNKQEVIQLVQKGEIPLYLTEYSETTTLRKDGLLITIPSYFYSVSPSFLRSRSFGVSSQSLLPEQSSEWIAYMTSYDIQQEWLYATYRLPSLSAIYENYTNESLDTKIKLDLLNKLNSGDVEYEQLTNKARIDLAIVVNQLLTGKLKVNQFKEEIKGLGLEIDKLDEVNTNN